MEIIYKYLVDVFTKENILVQLSLFCIS